MGLVIQNMEEEFLKIFQYTSGDRDDIQLYLGLAAILSFCRKHRCHDIGVGIVK